jgi:hypothetical protein
MQTNLYAISGIKTQVPNGQVLEASVVDNL